MDSVFYKLSPGISLSLENLLLLPKDSWVVHAAEPEKKLEELVLPITRMLSLDKNLISFFP